VNNAMSDFRDCGDCDHEPGDCLFCSDVVKNMFKPKKEAAKIKSCCAECYKGGTCKLSHRCEKPGDDSFVCLCSGRL
jgi:hypothetical protein